MSNSNGSHVNGTTAAEGGAHSQAYTHLKAGLDAWEMWQDLDTADKLQVILTHYAASQWLELEALGILAQFRHRPPGKWAQIKLLYKEIGGNAYDLEHAVDQLLQEPASPHVPNVWDQAITAQAFLEQEEDALDADVKDLVFPGCITLLAAPRASGKSLVALYLAIALATGGIFRGERVAKKRVLLVDRDNHPSLIRRRLRWLGAHKVTGLKVLTRDTAPPLTDADAWSCFPVTDYDVIIVDSLGTATEGVSEKEGRQTQVYLATLKDVARQGPAVLALDNTNKSAASIRGRGEKSDQADIVFECRNVTGWTPSQSEHWWEDLPDSGEHTWQQRATRRTGQAVLRIAFTPSKFRLGLEPDPFILEIDTRHEPWTLADVTNDVAAAGEQAQREQVQQERHAVEHAADMLITALKERPAESPMLQGEARDLLHACGLTRKVARTLLERGENHDIYPAGRWIIRPLPDHPSGRAYGVFLADHDRDGKRSEGVKDQGKYTVSGEPPFAVGSTPYGKRSTPFFSKEHTGVNDTDLLPQPGYSTAKGDSRFEKQTSGGAGGGRPFAERERSSGSEPDTLSREESV